MGLGEWLRFKYFYNVAGLCLSTLVFAVCLFVSAGNTEILTHQHCPARPDVYFTTDHHTIHQKVAEAVRNAKKFVQFSMYDVNESLFVNEYLEACKIANKNGVHVRFLLKTNITKILIDANLTDFSVYDDRLDPLWTDSVIIDSTSYIIPSFASQSAPATLQVVVLRRCPPIAREIQGFSEFFLRVSNGSLPAVIPPSIYGGSTPVRPTYVDDGSTMYMFYTPDVIVSPLRVNEGDLLESLLASNPKELLIYTDQTPGLPRVQWRKGDAFSLHIELRALVSLNRTTVKYLTAKDMFMNYGMFAWPKFQLRVCDDRSAGPQFIVSDDAVYLFSVPVGGEAEKFNRFFSVNLYSNSPELRQELVDTFYSVWNKSVSPTITWHDDLDDL